MLSLTFHTSCSCTARSIVSSVWPSMRQYFHVHSGTRRRCRRRRPLDRRADQERHRRWCRPNSSGSSPLSGSSSSSSCCCSTSSRQGICSATGWTWSSCCCFWGVAAAAAAAAAAAPAPGRAYARQLDGLGAPAAASGVWQQQPEQLARVGQDVMLSLQQGVAQLQVCCLCHKLTYLLYLKLTHVSVKCY